jgi:hypothetical protein
MTRVGSNGEPSGGPLVLSGSLVTFPDPGEA